MAIIVNLILVTNVSELKIMFLITSLLIIYKHKENIRRLLEGKETKIIFKKKN